MGKSKKQFLKKEDICRAEADEVKYMMLLNALKESSPEGTVENSVLPEDGDSENP